MRWGGRGGREGGGAAVANMMDKRLRKNRLNRPSPGPIRFPFAIHWIHLEFIDFVEEIAEKGGPWRSEQNAEEIPPPHREENAPRAETGPPWRRACDSGAGPAPPDALMGDGPGAGRRASLAEGRGQERGWGRER
jgi:hypothetical protein